MGEIYFIESDPAGCGAAAISLAKEMGYRTHYVTRRPAEHESLAVDPAELAHEVSMVDTYDIERLLHLFSGRVPRAVVAFGDDHLVLAAILADQLGVPHADATGLVNSRFRDRTLEFTKGLSRSADAGRSEIDELDANPPGGCPCAAGPIENGGRAGVQICRSQEEHAGVISGLGIRDADPRGARKGGSALAQGRVPGEEYIAELAWDRGKGDWKFLGYTKKLTAGLPHRVEAGAMFPHCFGGGQDERIEGIVRSWLAAVGHRCGAAQVEFKLMDGIPELAEIKPRPGGGPIRDLVGMTTGNDPVELYLRSHLGLPAGEPHDRRGEYGTILFLARPAGRKVSRVVPPTEPLPGVVQYSFAIDASFSDGAADSSSRLGYVIALADDFEESYRVAADFLESVQVEYRDDKPTSDEDNDRRCMRSTFIDDVPVPST